MSVTGANSQRAPAAVILAAGKGTRMKSDLPKVVHEVGGRAMVCAVVDACRAAGCERVIVVVGYGQQRVREALREQDIEFVVQEPQLGTGHAVGCARRVLEAGGATTVLVLAGDGPLIRASTLRAVLEKHRETGAAATLATSVIDDPTGYGRIVRDASGRFVEIVEHKNATPEQRKIREVNPSYYCFDRAALFGALDRVGRNEVSGEYYLTDAVGELVKEGRRVEVLTAVPPEDVLSINTPEELAAVDRIYRARGAEARGQKPGGRGQSSRSAGQTTEVSSQAAERGGRRLAPRTGPGAP